MIFYFDFRRFMIPYKKSTLIKSKKEGCQEMKDFVIFDQALKQNWVNCLCSDHDAPWKYIPTSLLVFVGGAFLFQCNYDCKLLCLSEHLPRFYKDIITYWQKIAATCPQNKTEVLDQVIWNNKFLIVIKNQFIFHADIRLESFTFQIYLMQKKTVFYLLTPSAKNRIQTLIFYRTTASFLLFPLAGKNY